MKATTVPLFCGVTLAAITAAGASHWWSVNYFAAAYPATLPAPALAPHAPAATKTASSITPPAPTASAPLAQTTPASVTPPPAASPALDAAQKKFFESLIAKMESLQNQNRDLMDQVAETNRDVMKLEFRVDTHSESFRPLPVSEEATSFESGAGVLPPRAEPVLLPGDE